MENPTSVPELNPMLAVRVDEMVGRDAEFKKLVVACEALRDSDPGTHLFYIRGEGGVGKTRMLEELLRWAGKLTEASLFYTDIIDLSDPESHSEIELGARIARSLRTKEGEKPTEEFREYFSLLARYRTHQEELVILPEIHKKLSEALGKGLDALSERGPVLVLLDTAETMQFEEDVVQRAVKIDDVFGGSYTWLADRVNKAGTQAQMMFVVAGRPTPAKLASNLVRLSNVGLPDDDPTARLIDLSGLRDGDEASYFDALQTTLIGLGYVDAADQVARITLGDRKKLREVTDGSPVALALTIHFWLAGQRESLRALMDRKNLTRAEKQTELRRLLVNALGYYTFGDATEPFQYLALMRTGMTRSDLSYLWGDGTEAEGDRVFDLLGRMSFTKKRMEYRFVRRLNDVAEVAEVTVLRMHDEIVLWMESGVFAREVRFPLGLRTKLYKLFEEKNEQVEDLICIYAPMVSADNDKRGSTTESTAENGHVARDAAARAEKHHIWAAEVKEEDAAPSPEAEVRSSLFTALRRERRRLQLALMHYGLRSAPRLGYDRYFEISQEAFVANQREMAAAIHADLVRWMVDRESSANLDALAASEGLDQAWIQSDLAYRWAQRMFWLDRESGSTKTLVLVDELRKRFGSELSPVFNRGLEVLRLSVEAFLPDQTGIATMRTAFDTCIQSLEGLREPTESRAEKDVAKKSPTPENHKVGSPFHTAVSAILGFAYYERAFFEAQFDGLDMAILDCIRSSQIYRDLRYELDQATALNDRAYFLALAGDPQAALTYAVDAAELRHRHGYGSPIAYGHNTTALILAMADRPQSALHHAQRALQIFRRIEDRYGEMLACRAVAEVFRRYAESIPQSRMAKHDDLLNACKYADAAVKIAFSRDDDEYGTTPKIKVDPVRQADCLNECAAAYRDLGKFVDENVDLCKPGESSAFHFDQSQKLFDEALSILPVGTAFYTSRVDILLNVAYLKYYRGEKLAAKTSLDMALELVPAEYRELGLAQNNKKRSLFWWQLPKAEALLIKLASEHPIADQSALLDPSIRILVYMDHLKGATRAKRRAVDTMYAAFKDMSVRRLKEYAGQCNKCSNELGVKGDIGETPIEFYFRENFGV